MKLNMKSIIVLFYLSSISFIFGQTLQVLNMNDFDIKSGNFTIIGTVSNPGFAESVGVRINNGVWEKAGGIVSWTYNVNYRNLSQISEFWYDPVTGTFHTINTRGAVYGDIAVEVAIFDHNNNVLDEKTYFIKIIPEEPTSDVVSGWYADDMIINLKTYPELSIFYITNCNHAIQHKQFTNLCVF